MPSTSVRSTAPGRAGEGETRSHIPPKRSHTKKFLCSLKRCRPMIARSVAHGCELKLTKERHGSSGTGVVVLRWSIILLDIMDPIRDRWDPTSASATIDRSPLSRLEDRSIHHFYCCCLNEPQELRIVFVRVSGAPSHFQRGLSNEIELSVQTHVIRVSGRSEVRVLVQPRSLQGPTLLTRTQSPDSCLVPHE